MAAGVAAARTGRWWPPLSLITEDWAEAFWDAVRPLVARAAAPKAHLSVAVEPGQQSGGPSSIVPSQLSVLMHSMGQLGHPPSEALMPSLLSYLESMAGSMTSVQDCQVGGASAHLYATHP